MPPQRRLWLDARAEFAELDELARAELTAQLEQRAERTAERHRANARAWRVEQRVRGIKPPPLTPDQRDRRRLNRAAARHADPERCQAKRRAEHARRAAREREAAARVRAAAGMGREPTDDDRALAERRRRRLDAHNARARAKRAAARAAGLRGPTPAPRTPEQRARARARYVDNAERLRAAQRLRERARRNADPDAYRKRLNAWRAAHREHVRAQDRAYYAKRRRER